MAELADARDLKSRSPKGSAGSTPAAGTCKRASVLLMLFFYFINRPSKLKCICGRCHKLAIIKWAPDGSKKRLVRQDLSGVGMAVVSPDTKTV